MKKTVQESCVGSKLGQKKKGMMTRMRTQEAEDHDHDHDHDEIEPIITYLSKDDL
jgi:hypothetical protein